MKNFSPGFIGCGAMGTAIIKGIIQSKTVKAENIWIYDVSEEKMDLLKNELSVNRASNYAELCQKSNCIFLAVKPADLQQLLARLKEQLNREHLIVSVIAGKSINFMESVLENNVRIIRLMPNTPCLIGEGVVAIAKGSRATDKDLDRVENMISSLGLTLLIEEKHLDAVTALSGSGPGYVYLFMEALVDGGVNIGLNRQIAEKMVIQTVLGSAQMAKSTGKSFSDLKNSVTSPGGTTIAALRLLESNSFHGTVMNAVQEALQKAGSLKDN